MATAMLRVCVLIICVAALSGSDLAVVVEDRRNKTECFCQQAGSVSPEALVVEAGPGLEASIHTLNPSHVHGLVEGRKVFGLLLLGGCEFLPLLGGWVRWEIELVRPGWREGVALHAPEALVQGDQISGGEVLLQFTVALSKDGPVMAFSSRPGLAHAAYVAVELNDYLEVKCRCHFGQKLAVEAGKGGTIKR